MTDSNASLLLKALTGHTVFASVTDVDHHRIRGGMAVETDYIITVTGGAIPEFRLSKTFSSFRTLAHQLKKAADKYTKTNNALPPEAVKVAKYCELVSHLVESQKTQYLGKVNYMYVKVLAKQRCSIINDVLEATINYFPEKLDVHPLLLEVASAIETFLLTDFCEQETKEETGTEPKLAKVENNPLSWIPFANDKKPIHKRIAAVVPITRKDRRSQVIRAQDEKELLTVGEDAKLLVDDDRPQTELLPSYSRPVPTVRSGGTKIGNIIENNPAIFMAIFMVVVYILHQASEHKVTLDLDIAMLAIFSAFCLGLHTPRPMIGGFDRPPTMKATIRDPSGRLLLRRSMLTSPRASGMGTLKAEVPQEHADVIMGSPMQHFPEDAEIGSHTNCYSVPDASDFLVRGPTYLQDKKKVPSGDYFFPCRGVDLFLTDACPQNVGRNDKIFGGHLREKPSFIINFILPWGVLLFYSEIPEYYVQFLEASYNEQFDKSKLPSFDEMPPSKRAVCRFLMNDMKHKNRTLKIVPVVVDGPWVVRQVVGGKPAIVGNKMDINYIYQPAEGNKAAYLEADLDIAASAAARGILSVARSYCQVLTIDLGFVVQGNSADELPEQMLVGCRLHGVDPLSSPPYPPMKDEFFGEDFESEDDTGSVTPITK